MGHRNARSFLVALSLCWLALLWPAFVNGGPFLFVDSTAYVRGVDAAVQSLTGTSTAWSAPASPGSEQVGTATAVREAGPADDGGRIVLAGRSVYYGALAYLSQRLGGFWPLVLAQGLLAAAAIVLTVDRLWPAWRGRLRTLLVVPGVLLCTSAPYFVGFAMPDILLPLAILAIGNLAAFWSEDGRWRRAFWFGLLVLALLSHTATLLVAILTVAVGLAASRLLAGIPKPALVALVTAVALAIVGEAAFTLGVKEIAGRDPVRPPFITARLVDDGPGYDYLRETCPGNGFALCRMIHGRPVNSDVFLWSADPRFGTFLSGSTRDARELSAEQTRFAWAVFRAKPLEVIGSSLGSVWRQAGETDLGEFNYDAGTRAHLDAKLPEAERTAARDTAAYRGDMPTRFVADLAPWLALLSAGLVAATILTGRRNGRDHGRVALFSALILLGILFNIAVSGAISTPHDRYQMRALWLLPLLATALAPWLLQAFGPPFKARALAQA